MSKATTQQKWRLSNIFSFWSKGQNTEPRPYYIEDEKVWLNSFQDLIIPRKDAQKRFGNAVYCDQYVERPQYDPKIKWTAKGKEHKDFFTTDKKEELQRLLHSAITVIWQSPTGRHLIKTAKRKKIRFEFFAKENSDMAGYWSRQKNMIGLNALCLTDVPSMVTTLIHELTHTEQSHSKRHKSCITPSVEMKYNNVIEADARAHEMAVCLELAMGVNGFHSHHPLQNLLSQKWDWAMPVIDKLTQDPELTKDNIVTKAARHSFDQYYINHRLRTYYEDNYLKNSTKEKIFSTVAPIAFLGIFVAISLATRLVNSGLKHQFQKAAFPKFIANKMTLAGTPYMQDAVKEKDYSDPLYTGISHQGMHHLKQPGYWRFLDLAFISRYTKSMDQERYSHQKVEKFWQRMNALNIMHKRASYEFAPQSTRWQESFERYDDRELINRLNQQNIQRLPSLR